MVDCPCIASVVSPVLQVAEWLAAPIWRPVKYLYNYTTNFKNLEAEVDKLKNTRKEVERKIIAAKRNVEVIYENVEKWQDSAQEMIDKAEQLIKEKEQFIREKANNPRCFKGLCSNFIIHYKQSRKAFKLKRDDIDPLLQKELGPISYQTNPPEIWLRSSENYLAFESRDTTVTNVRGALNDENVHMIGVYGMGGLGKTMLVQEIGRKAKEEGLFEDVVLVEVSEFPDIQKIQTVIADNLGVKFDNESGRAKKLYSRMEGQKILLILDNIWEPLEFEKIGIPCGADRGRNKFLFTTRKLDVLESMGSTKNFGMGILNEEEAWNLFEKMAGNIIQKHELHSLQNDVCKECGGLPLVISAIAKALRYKSELADWKYALQELKGLSKVKYTKFLEKEYTKIALSYKYLSDELKKTFLISSLMENNTSISDLFRHVVCLNILGGVNLTMEDERVRLNKLVRDLKDACLLLDGVESDQFAMHDVIRDVARTFAHEEHHAFTARNDIQQDWKDKEKLQKCIMISLPGKSTIISQLWPNNLDCSNLEYFSMTDLMNSSFEIPEGFFTVMPKLRVLNLVGLWQMSLPSSIHHLTNLQTLCLHKSSIKVFSVIGKLNKLKVLSLRDSYLIEEFPTEIGQLTQLRLLDLSYCCFLKVISPNVISKLTKLEELYLKGCPIQWKIEVLRELKLLSNLTSVELDIKDHKVLPKDFFSRELIRYNISVGNLLYPYPTIGEQECLKILKLVFNPIIHLSKLCGIKDVELLCLAEYLDDHEHSQFNLQSNEITLFFNKKVILLDLKVLVLKNIISRKIWDSQLPPSSFQNLKELILYRCTKIKYVFPCTITKNLQRLQYLEIQDCTDLEEIVATEEITEAATSFVFPEVNFLKLENLPELATFYPGIHTLEWPKLEELVMKDCDKLKMFNSESNSLCLDHKINHDLEVFELKTQSMVIRWSRQSNALEFSHDKSANIPLQLLQRFESLEKLQLRGCEYKEIKSVYDLPNLNVLHVEECSKLVSLVPSSPTTARSLVQLKELSISNCGMLAEILENKSDLTTIEIDFQKLTKLSLDWLESLTCFCSGNHSLNFPSLEELIIVECPNLNTFFREISNVSEFTLQSNEITPFFNQKVHFHGLELLELENVSFGKIWDSQPSISSYQNLTHLTLCKCDKIKYVFPLSIAKSLQHLLYFKLKSCKALERIVTPEEGTKAGINFFFPQVSIVKLQYLPEFTDFYPGLHTSEWPKLEKLVVKDCPKFKMFTSKPNSLCFDQKINHDLMVFELTTQSMVMSWSRQSTLLTISGDKSANIPLQLLQRFESLEKLHLRGCEYKEIKSVYDLSNLNYLYVDECSKLVSLVPSSTSLQNLEVLIVSGCNELVNITSLLTTRSLVQLKQLSISNCRMLTEVLEDEGDAATCTEIVFNNLNKLTLTLLNSLTCFCSGNCSFSFPSLEELGILGCPNLEIFCQGSICTPKLERAIKFYELNTDGVVEIGNNDLNTAIQQEYKKQKELAGSSEEKKGIRTFRLLSTTKRQLAYNMFF